MLKLCVLFSRRVRSGVDVFGRVRSLTRVVAVCCVLFAGVICVAHGTVAKAGCVVGDPAASENAGGLSVFDDGRPGRVVLPSSSLTVSSVDALRAFNEARGWLSAWSVPDGALPTPAGCRGACVQIRLTGEVIGRGTAMDWPDTPAGGPSVLQRAMSAAMVEADARLPVADDLFRADAVRELARHMTLSVELIGVPTPMVVETWLQVETDLQPGLDGVAARSGSRWSAVSASRMLASNTLAGVALRRAVSEASEDPTAALLEPAELRKRFNIRLFRFRGVHAAQAEPGGEPVLLERGNPAIRRSIEADGYAEVERGLIAHLSARVRRAMADGGKPCGMYEPWSDRCVTPASATELAIVGIALARAGRVLPGFDDDATRVDALRSAADVLMLLADRGLYPDAGGDALSASGIVVLLATLSDAGTAIKATRFDARTIANVESLRRRSLATLAQSYDGSTGFVSSVPAGAKGLVALALVSAQRAALGVDDAEVVRLAEQARAGAASAVRSVFRSTPEGVLASEMPWLGWAELALVASNGESEAMVPSAVSLRSMRRGLWASQIGPFDVDADGQDVVGGLVFTAGSGMLPSWHTARPVAFLASMLNRSGLTSDEERIPELGRLLAAGQFLERLMLTDGGLWLAANRTASVHGVRSATFNARQPIAASAFALLAFTEIRSGLESLAAETAVP